MTANGANHVHLFVRAKGLAESMSRYLVRRIEANPKITLRTETELIELEGDRHLDEIAWRHSSTGEVKRRAIRHLFVMTGASPSTDWLLGCMACDEKGSSRRART